jgi:predicted nuclease of predicted toxin-antitoxin system
MDAADIEIMAHAAKYDYVVQTHDLDFSAILAATQETKTSVVQIRSDNLSPAVIGEPLIAALQQMTPARLGTIAFKIMPDTFIEAENGKSRILPGL